MRWRIRRRWSIFATWRNWNAEDARPGRHEGTRITPARAACVGLVFARTGPADGLRKFLPRRPQVQADEGSYLLNAAMLAGHIHANPTYGYYSGYSLLLLPAFLFHSQPIPIHHGALLINALLVASTPLALYRLTRELWPAIAESTHVASALIATCYAQVLILSQYTMSESALVPLCAWLLASGMNMLQRERIGSALASGAIAGLLFLVHPRGAAMAAPILLVFSLFAFASGRGRRMVAVAWLVAVAVAALHVPLELRAGRPAGGGGGYSLGVMLSRLSEPSAWSWLLFNLIGATTEALVSSLGIFAFGVHAATTELRTAWKHGADRCTPKAAALLASLTGMAIALLATAAFFAPPERAVGGARGSGFIAHHGCWRASGIGRRTPSRRRIPQHFGALLAPPAGIATLAPPGSPPKSDAAGPAVEQFRRCAEWSRMPPVPPGLVPPGACRSRRVQGSRLVVDRPRDRLHGERAAPASVTPTSARSRSRHRFACPDRATVAGSG